MDRFIDEQDPARDRSLSPNYFSLLYGTESKKSHSPTLNISSKSAESHSNGDSANPNATAAAASGGTEEVSSQQ